MDTSKGVPRVPQTTLLPSPIDQVTLLIFAVTVTEIPPAEAVADCAAQGWVHSHTGTPTAPMHPGSVHGAVPITGLVKASCW